MSRRGQVQREALFWHYPHYQLYQQGGATPCDAVRAGAFKLEECYDDRRVELYSLGADGGEGSDVAEAIPGKADELRAPARRAQGGRRASLPTRDPAHDPAKHE